MRNEFFANIEAGAAAVRSFACSSADRLARQLASDPAQESQNQLPCPEKPAEPTVRFSRQVLADFRSNVGRYAPETGGMMGSTEDTALVDLCHFDTLSRNTPGTFYYDVDSMTKVFHDWAEKGYRVTGIYHSHPRGCIRPSYHDISTALIHLRFFEQDFFYLPILRPARKGLFTLYFYIVHLKGDALTVDLDHVLRAESGSRYALCTFAPWHREYSVAEMDEYRTSLEAQEQPETPAEDPAAKAPAQTPDYFGKVRSLYPQKVLEQKVVVCIGVGGARSFLENCARSGLRNFILMDPDIVSPSNVATQAVFISEMGRKKVEVISDRIRDINPDAQVLCIPRALDDAMSDEAFKAYLDRFPGHKATDYLILDCTDNFAAQKRSSMLALKYGMPYLAAMMYAHGLAAELIFVYPGVTESCPRCLLRSRFEQYEQGYQNDVDSSACPIFATERMNATKGYLALMLLLYHVAPGSLLLGDGLGLLIAGEGKSHGPLGALLQGAFHSGGSREKRRLLPRCRLERAFLRLAFLLLGAFQKGVLLDRGGAVPGAQLHHPQHQAECQQQGGYPHQRGDVPTPVGPDAAEMDHRLFGTPYAEHRGESPLSLQKGRNRPLRFCLVLIDIE